MTKEIKSFLCDRCHAGNAQIIDSMFGVCNNPNCPGPLNPNMPESKNILQEADELTAGDRRKEYGHPKDNFKDIADMWGIILRKTREYDLKISPDEVVLMMLCLKICRGKQGYKRDTTVDLAGYARCLELLHE